MGNLHLNGWTATELIGLVSALIALIGFITGRHSLAEFLGAQRQDGKPARVPWVVALSLVAAIVALVTLNQSSNRTAFRSDTRRPSIDLTSPALLDSLRTLEFQVDQASIQRGFEYRADGEVLYGRGYFRPGVHFTPGDNPAVLISIPSSLSMAGIVGLDRDGQRTYYVVNLSSMTSSFCKCPASKLYWSPDKRHLVSLDSYEGSWFTVLDFATGSIRTGPFLGNLETLWYLEGTPKWTPDGRILLTKAIEVLSAVDARSPADADRAQTEGPLNVFLLSFDTQTLEVSPKPTSNR